MTSENREAIGNFQVVDGDLVTRREVLLMGALAAGTMVATSASQAGAQGIKEAANTGIAGNAGNTTGHYAARDFNHLLNKKMEENGLSNKQIEQHLKLYQGYVAKANDIQGLIGSVDLSAPAPNATYSPFREMLIEQSYALNGVVYHELYFGNIGGSGGEPTGELRAALEARFGSLGKFMDYFKAAGKSMRGWVIIGWNTRDGQLHPYGLDMHNMYVPANVVPVVVLDVYEHAYMIDYGINRGSYIDAVLKNMDWEACNKRFAIAHKHPTGLDSTV